ncbi:hypothetical protein FHR50_001269 [Xanthomonas arboricola]
MRVADQEGLFGGFDQAVQMRVAVGVFGMQAVEQGKDQQRGQALRGRCVVVEARAVDGDRERRAGVGLMLCQVVRV